MDTTTHKMKASASKALSQKTELARAADKKAMSSVKKNGKTSKTVAVRLHSYVESNIEQLSTITGINRGFNVNHLLQSNEFKEIYFDAQTGYS